MHLCCCCFLAESAKNCLGLGLLYWGMSDQSWALSPANHLVSLPLVQLSRWLLCDLPPLGGRQRVALASICNSVQLDTLLLQTAFASAFVRHWPNILRNSIGMFFIYNKSFKYQILGNIWFDILQKSIKKLDSVSSHRNQIYLQYHSFNLFKKPKKRAKLKIKPKMTLNDLYITSEVKVELWKKIII